MFIFILINFWSWILNSQSCCCFWPLCLQLLQSQSPEVPSLQFMALVVQLLVDIALQELDCLPTLTNLLEDLDQFSWELPELKVTTPKLSLEQTTESNIQVPLEDLWLWYLTNLGQILWDWQASTEWDDDKYEEYVRISLF